MILSHDNGATWDGTKEYKGNKDSIAQFRKEIAKVGEKNASGAIVPPVEKP